MKHHVFVTMPFDIKKDSRASRSISTIYAELMISGLKSFGQMKKREPATFLPTWKLLISLLVWFGRAASEFSQAFPMRGDDRPAWGKWNHFGDACATSRTLTSK